MTEIFDMWMRGMWDLLALARAWVAVITPLCVGAAWMLSPLAAASVVTMAVRARSAAAASVVTMAVRARSAAAASAQIIPPMPSPPPPPPPPIKIDVQAHIDALAQHRRIARELLEISGSKPSNLCGKGARESMIRYDAMGLLKARLYGSGPEMCAKLTDEGKAHINKYLGAP